MSTPIKKPLSEGELLPLVLEFSKNQYLQSDVQAEFIRQLTSAPVGTYSEEFLHQVEKLANNFIVKETLLDWVAWERTLRCAPSATPEVLAVITKRLLSYPQYSNLYQGIHWLLSRLSDEQKTGYYKSLYPLYLNQVFIGYEAYEVLNELFFSRPFGSLSMPLLKEASAATTRTSSLEIPKLDPSHHFYPLPETFPLTYALRFWCGIECCIQSYPSRKKAMAVFLAECQYLQTTFATAKKRGLAGKFPEPLQHLVRKLYLSGDTELIALYKSLELPAIDDVSTHAIETPTPTLALSAHATKKDIENAEGVIIKLQREARARLRTQQENARIEDYIREVQNIPESKPLSQEASAFKATIIKDRESPYTPTCDVALAKKITASTKGITLGDTIAHCTSPVYFNSLLDDALYGRKNLLGNEIKFEPGILNRRDLPGGDGSLVCFGRQSIDSSTLENKPEGYIKIELALSKINLDNPALAFKQLDFTHRPQEQFIRIGKLALGLMLYGGSENTAILMFKYKGNSIRVTLPRDMLISHNMQQMDQILTLNFFRFVDALNPNYPLANELKTRIYSALNALSEDHLSVCLKEIGIAASETSEVNFFGGYQLDLHAINKITFYLPKNHSSRLETYTLDMPVFINALQQGDMAALEEARRYIPNLFNSYRFISFLLSQTIHPTIRQKLIVYQSVCKIPIVDALIASTINVTHLLDLLKSQTPRALTPEIADNIRQIKEICDELFSDQYFFGNAALNRKMLLNAQIATLLTPNVLAYIFTNAPTPETCIKRNSTGSVSLKDAIYWGFSDGLRVIQKMPNNEPVYDTQGYVQQHNDYQEHSLRVVHNIISAVGIDMPHEQAPIAVQTSSLRIRLQRVIEAIRHIKKQEWSDKLLFVPGYSSDQIRDQVNYGLTAICIENAIPLHPADNGYIIQNETLKSFCEKFLKNSDALLNGKVIHYFYDRAHLEAALEQDTGITFSDGTYTYQDLFTEMVALLEKYPENYSPYASEQLDVRLTTVEQHLKTHFSFDDQYIPHPFELSPSKVKEVTLTPPHDQEAPVITEQNPASDDLHFPKRTRGAYTGGDSLTKINASKAEKNVLESCKTRCQAYLDTLPLTQHKTYRGIHSSQNTIAPIQLRLQLRNLLEKDTLERFNGEFRKFEQKVSGNHDQGLEEFLSDIGRILAKTTLNSGQQASTSKPPPSLSS